MGVRTRRVKHAFEVMRRCNDLRWLAFVGFALSFVGLYIVWKILRTPGEL
jgi:hypothetical protein